MHQPTTYSRDVFSICLFLCVSVCVHTPVCRCIWRPVAGIQYYFQSLSTLGFSHIVCLCRPSPSSAYPPTLRFLFLANRHCNECEVLPHTMSDFLSPQCWVLLIQFHMSIIHPCLPWVIASQMFCQLLNLFFCCYGAA